MWRASQNGALLSPGISLTRSSTNVHEPDLSMAEMSALRKHRRIRPCDLRPVLHTQFLVSSSPADPQGIGGAVVGCSVGASTDNLTGGERPVTGVESAVQRHFQHPVHPRSGSCVLPSRGRSGKYWRFPLAVRSEANRASLHAVRAWGYPLGLGLQRTAKGTLEARPLLVTRSEVKSHLQMA